MSAALEGTSGEQLAVAILAWDGEDVTAAVTRLCQAHPETRLLSASDAGVPRPIVLALNAGACGVLEFRSQSREEILAQIRSWVDRHQRGRLERELLLRLRQLNEDFLKQVIAAQKRNLELEAQLKGEEAEDEGEKPRVLIVDDEEVVRGVLQAVLTRNGFPHSSVHTGEAAVQAVQRERFGLVITDKNLPGISGLEVLRAVKEHSPDTDVILMTGYASMDSAIDALNYGAAAYLEKPFEHVKKVVETIETVLARRKDRFRHRRYLMAIKERNREFLDRYRAVRADLEAWLGSLGMTLDADGARNGDASPRVLAAVRGPSSGTG
ncbi:MAG: response regulator [Myxococcaceae bacterium]|nr:response regulator [Myxococcaceae bacterium]